MSHWMETVSVYSGTKDSGPIVLSSTLTHNSLHIKPMNAPTSTPLLCGQKSRTAHHSCAVDQVAWLGCGVVAAIAWLGRGGVVRSGVWGWSVLGVGGKVGRRVRFIAISGRPDSLAAIARGLICAVSFDYPFKL